MHICTPRSIRMQIIATGILLFLVSFVPCDGIVCYHCDSIALAECAMTLNELDTLPYVSCLTELTCKTSIVDTITYRGCGNDTPSVNATYSKTCRDNLCNRGVYPPGRLKCHHCEGETCVAPPIGKPRPCRYHHENDKCYTEVSSANLTYRGCASDTNHTITASVLYCDINGCNDAPAATTLQCAQCDSNNGRGCKMDLFNVNTANCNITLYETCSMMSLLTQKESCFIYQQKDRVVRGCTHLMPADVEADMMNVQLCEDHEFCNLRCISRLRCLSCDSTANEECFSNATKITASLCGSAEASSCYACEYSDWSVKRGCGKPPNLASSNDVIRCYECDKDDACNIKPLTRCYHCTSDNGSGCATWDWPSNIDIEECQVPAASCIIATFLNNTTIRGCQSADLNCELSNLNNCQICEGNFCNKSPFKEESLSCHQCIGCSSIASKPLPCAIKQNEASDTPPACLEYFDTYTGNVTRGCRSNSTLYYECMLRNAGSGCRLCYTNGCNATPVETLNATTKLQLLTPKRNLSALRNWLT